MKKKTLNIKAVLFDFDGTLTKPGVYDFKKMQRETGCPKNVDILELIKEKTKEEADRMMTVLKKFEYEGSKISQPNHGAEDFVSFLRSGNIKTGIITRNTMESVELALRNFKTIKKEHFDIIITRNTPVKPKPNPDGIFFAAEKFDIQAEEIMIVGDYILDIESGINAGALAVLVSNHSDYRVDSAHFTVENLNQIKELIKNEYTS